MDTANQNLFTRDDTFFGICQGLGEDLGINPDLFRVAMIPALFFFPVQTLAAYFGAGVVVLLTRLIFSVRGRRSKKAKALPVQVAVASGPAPQPETVERELEMAA